MALLFDGGKLRVTLVDDEVQEGVPDLLLGNLRHALPLLLALEIAELDDFGGQVSVLGLEGVVGVAGQAQVDVLLPGPEGVDPVIEGGDFLHAHKNCVS